MVVCSPSQPTWDIAFVEDIVDENNEVGLPNLGEQVGWLDSTLSTYDWSEDIIS